MDVRLAKKYVMFTPRGGNQPWRIDLHASQEMWDKKLHVSGMGAAAARAFLIITRTFFSKHTLC